MVKINENEAIISRHELFVLIGAAGARYIEEKRMLMEAPMLAKFSLEFAEDIYFNVSRHIWDDKKLLEEYIKFLMDKITPTEKEEKDRFFEDKQSIRMLLLAALQKTRAFHDLKDLKEDPCCGTVAEFESGGRRQINTIGDSGIAMIKDILAHL